MSFLNRLRPATQHATPQPLGSARFAQHNGAMAKPGPSPADRGVRASNGLKDFLWHLDGIGRGTLLDLGPAWQSTLSFFIERGFKVYSEDLLTAWRDYLRAEEERLRAVPAGGDAGDTSPAARAEAFLRENLSYAEESFDAVLLWDLLDYLEAGAAAKVVTRLSDLVRTGGVVLAAFHVRKPESFHRYRVHDAQSIELIPAPQLVPPQQVYQNREILNLFSRFQSSRTFVGRDQLREGLFLR
jgi:hypothetical protein